MRTDPFTDAVLFLAGDTDDHHRLGLLGVALAATFALALVASLAIAVANWRADPLQRRGVNLWLWFVRLLMGAMWFEGSLWKLPLPVADGLRYWTEQLRDNSAFVWHHQFVTDFLLPNLIWLGPLVWLTEFAMGLALVLGFAVRLAGIVGILFTANIWIGVYHNTGEWPWTYAFIMLIEGTLVALRAGHALGLDAIVARRPGLGAFARLHRLAS